MNYRSRLERTIQEGRCALAFSPQMVINSHWSNLSLFPYLWSSQQHTTVRCLTFAQIEGHLQPSPRQKRKETAPFIDRTRLLSVAQPNWVKGTSGVGARDVWLFRGICIWSDTYVTLDETALSFSLSLFSPSLPLPPFLPTPALHCPITSSHPDSAPQSRNGKKLSLATKTLGHYPPGNKHLCVWWSDSHFQTTLPPQLGDKEKTDHASKDTSSSQTAVSPAEKS